MALSVAALQGNACSFCDADGRTTKLASCSRCGLAWYCSKEHQKADYKAHKTLCLALGAVMEMQSKITSDARFDNFEESLEYTATMAEVLGSILQRALTVGADAQYASNHALSCSLEKKDCSIFGRAALSASACHQPAVRKCTCALVRDAVFGSAKLTKSHSVRLVERYLIESYFAACR